MKLQHTATFIQKHLRKKHCPISRGHTPSHQKVSCQQRHFGVYTFKCHVVPKISESVHKHTMRKTTSRSCQRCVNRLLPACTRTMRWTGQSVQNRAYIRPPGGMEIGILIDAGRVPRKCCVVTGVV